MKKLIISFAASSLFNFEPIYAGWINGTIYLNEDNVIPNAILKSTLNNHEYYVDENGDFDFGFPQGLHEFDLYYEGEVLETIELQFLPRETNTVNIIVNSNITPGDLNFDSSLNVLDVIIMVNIILDIIDPSSQQLLIADMNNDTIINIQDIIVLINEILNIN